MDTKSDTLFVDTVSELPPRSGLQLKPRKRIKKSRRILRSTATPGYDAPLMKFAERLRQVIAPEFVVQ